MPSPLEETTSDPASLATIWGWRLRSRTRSMSPPVRPVSSLDQADAEEQVATVGLQSTSITAPVEFAKAMYRFPSKSESIEMLLSVVLAEASVERRVVWGPEAASVRYLRLFPDVKAMWVAPEVWS